MDRLTHYRFRSVWHVEAAFDDVCLVLRDLQSYPAWWREVREVTALDGTRFSVVARSLLPYNLRFLTEEVPGKQGPGRIEARLSGDLEGYVRWSVEDLGQACRLVYEQEVVTHKALLNALAPLARLAFKANHALMMRHGQAGLRTFLAGYASGASRAGRT